MNSATNDSVWVNDIHSGLNPTSMRKVLVPQSEEELVRDVRQIARGGMSIAVSGCRHAMGGQQFVTDGILLDMREMKRVLQFDSMRGLLRVEAGIQWPQLIRSYLELQREENSQWGITQKQTGADMLTLGGSLSVNAHGRGLTLPPLIHDVEGFTLLKADGEVVQCSRAHNTELFSLVIGGYGLFGVVMDVTLRLTPRQRLERVVEIITADDLYEKFQQRIADGYLYGDFQFSINEASPQFLQEGVFSCYRPTTRSVTLARGMDEARWLQLLYLAYTDRARGYEKYVEYYLSTNGQVYWSDTHQLGPYLPDYAGRIRQMGGTTSSSSLLITELYVPRQTLASFLADAAQMLPAAGMTVIYGTVRLIEKDSESFLPWAKESYACVIFNLLVEHSAEGKARARDAFRALIDLAIARQGSYFLTYHRFATRSQVAQCYPRFGRFLELKKAHDPQEVFQSDWYRHHCHLWASGG